MTHETNTTTGAKNGARPSSYSRPFRPKTPIAENNAPPGLRSLLGKPYHHRPGRASPGLTAAFQLAILLDVVVSPHGTHSKARHQHRHVAPHSGPAQSTRWTSGSRTASSPKVSNSFE